MSETKTDETKGRLPVFPLTRRQTESVLNGLKARGATFFTDKQLKQLTKDNPENPRLQDILANIGKNQDLPEEILKK